MDNYLYERRVKNMIKIAICDDEEMQVDFLSKHILLTNESLNLNIDIVSATTNSEYIYKLVKESKIDVLFLDISFDKHENFGIEFAEKLRKLNPDFYLVFLTGRDDFVMDSFKCVTFDYILKPLDSDKLRRVLLRISEDIAAKQMSASRDFMVNFNNGISINTGDIIMIEKIGTKDKICTVYNDYYTYGTFSELLEILPGNFQQCSRAHIINTKRVIYIDRKHFTVNLIKDLHCQYTSTFEKNILTKK